MAQIGSLIEVAMTPESSAGVAETLLGSEFLPNAGADFDDSKEDVTLQAGFGRIENISQSRVSLLGGGGKIASPLGVLNAGYFLTAIFGQAPTTTDNMDGTYLHEFVLLNNNTHKTFTVATNDPENGYRAFAGQILNDFIIEAEKNGEFIVIDSNWLGKKSASPTPVNSAYRSDEYFFTPDQITVRKAANEAGLAAASDLTVEKVSLGASKNAIRKGKLGSNEVDRVRNQRFGGTGSMDIELDTDADRVEALDNTQRAMRIRFTVPGTSPVQYLEFIIVNFTWDNPTQSKDLDSLSLLTRSFKFERGSGGMIKANLVNAQAAYPYSS
jgi:hypothetical protein